MRAPSKTALGFPDVLSAIRIVAKRIAKAKIQVSRSRTLALPEFPQW